MQNIDAFPATALTHVVSDTVKDLDEASGREILVHTCLFDAVPLGCSDSYLTGLDAVDVLRFRVPLHHPCTDDALENGHMKTKVEQWSKRKWITYEFAKDNKLSHKSKAKKMFMAFVV